MSDMTALAQKLKAVAGTGELFEDGARVISRNGAPSPLAAMLEVIDETVLERTLEFSAGKTSVRIVAAGRRLRGFSAVTSGKKADTALIGQTISREEPDTLDMALTILSDAFDKATQLTVRSMPPDPFVASGERGVPAADLMEMWQVTSDHAPETPADTPMGAFLQANAAKIAAVLHTQNGEITTTRGATGDLQRVWDKQVDAFLKAQTKMTAQPDAPRFFSLEGVMPDGSAAALAIAGDEVALIMHDARHVGSLVKAWLATFD